MRTVLLVGGPADGQRHQAHDGQRVIMVVPPMRLDVRLSDPIDPSERTRLVAYKVELFREPGGYSCWIASPLEDARSPLQILFERYGKAKP